MQSVMQMFTRKTDQPLQGAVRGPVARQERIYQREGQWYFRRRNAGDMGPFVDKQNAYWALARYIRQQA